MILPPDIWHGRVIAHRGSRLLWPENTMLAFGASLDAGAGQLETDLHLTADGHIVCFHDDTVERTTDGTGPVSQLTLAQLRKLDAGYRHRIEGNYRFRGRNLKVPTLGEVLATFPDVGVIVDLKQEGLEKPLVELLDRMGAWRRVIVGSFDDDRLARVVHESGGAALVSVGRRMATRWWAASRLLRPGPAGPAALQVPPSMHGLQVVDRRFVHAAHAGGVAVQVWTVNRRSEMEHFWSLGVDAVITDRPDIAAGTGRGSGERRFPGGAT